MSTIVADNLTGKTAAGNVTVTSEGGSATMQLQQGLVKAFCHVNQSVPTVLDSFNESSFTDVTASEQELNVTNLMSSVNYNAFGHGTSNVAGSWGYALFPENSTTLNTTTKRRTNVSYVDGFPQVDNIELGINYLGDLA